MITVPELVEEYVKRSPYLEESLAHGLINLSSLARLIQPQIRKKLLKDIQLGAIVMALKRLANKKYPEDSKLASILQNLGDITVRSNLIEYTFSNSSTLAFKQSLLFQYIAQEKISFLAVTDGVFESSMFVSSNLEEQIEKIFNDEKLLHKISALSSITIVIPKEAVYVPGVYYSILKCLAWEGISFVEVVSSFTELTIFIESKNVDQAFSVLKSLT